MQARSIYLYRQRMAVKFSPVQSGYGHFGFFRHGHFDITELERFPVGISHDLRGENGPIALKQLFELLVGKEGWHAVNEDSRTHYLSQLAASQGRCCPGSAMRSFHLLFKTHGAGNLDNDRS